MFFRFCGISRRFLCVLSVLSFVFGLFLCVCRRFFILYCSLLMPSFVVWFSLLTSVFCVVFFFPVFFLYFSYPYVVQFALSHSDTFFYGKLFTRMCPSWASSVCRRYLAVGFFFFFFLFFIVFFDSFCFFLVFRSVSIPMFR